MAIILFLMDTSGSMNQRTCFGPTYLDYGKIAVENFMKIRAKDPVNWKDRYMLVTCEEFPASIKVGWRDVTRDPGPNVYFKEQLSRLVATTMTNLGGAIKCSLDLLNIHRVQNGLDNYGQGRNPFLLEPAVVIIISDGCKLTNTQTVTETLTLPMHPSFPGSELTKDPFRWDQRIFSVVLRFKGNVDNDYVEHAASDSQINAMCEVTGGRSYTISSSKSLLQALESINQKVLSGVVVQLEHLPSEAERNLAADVWRVTRRMIIVNKTNSAQLAHWPIPENFWPVRETRPIRTAIPVVFFSSESKRVNVLDNLPFDKYELEPSPLTQHILELRQPTVCWHTFVKNSGRDKGIKGPFGYLKASVKGTCVNLFVMPYNYPVLFPLLEELVKDMRMQPTNQWITDFKSYLAACPLYYFAPLRVALRRIGVPVSLLTLIPEGGDSVYFANFTKSLKAQAKTEAARYMDQIKSREESVTELDVPRKYITKQDIVRDLNRRNKEAEEETEHGSLVKNPFHTPQHTVLSQLKLLRKEIGLERSCNTTTESLAEKRARFSMPSSKMGQYQDAFSKALRTVDVHQRGNHMFGNPFKLGSKKQMNNMIAADEVDEIRIQQKVANRKKQPPLKPFPANPPPAAATQDGGVVPQKYPINNMASNGNTPPTPPLSSVSPPPTPPITPPPLPSNPWAAGPPPESLKNIPPPIPDKVLRPTSPKLPTITPWAFSPTGPDIAASIGSGNEVSKNSSSDSPTPTTKPNSTPVTGATRKGANPSTQTKDTSTTTTTTTVPVVNPLMKESFLKFSDTDSFIDKNRIKDTFSGSDTNGVNRENNRADDTNHKPKKMKLSNNADVRRDNKKLKDMIQKELRKPGKNYDPMFQLLDQVKGNTDTKLRFVEDIISDAEKFRKKLLIERLKSWQKELANR